MPNPDSLLTRVRRTLAMFLDVQPDPGEAWCMDCVLNGSRTQILPADSAQNHLGRHSEKIREGEVPGHNVYIITANNSPAPM